MTFVWNELLTALTRRQDLTLEQSRWAMSEIMTGRASPAQLAGFMMALHTKGETIDEVRGLSDTMIEFAVPLEIPGRKVDLVGTGGDLAKTANISTMASLVVAAAGVQLVKHGNRATSSLSGSADMLEALGLSLELRPEHVAAICSELGITFCFANTFHPSMRHVSGTRRELGVVTVFNFLGPITNPSRPQANAIGCADLRMAPILAGVLAERGNSALVFRSEDGLDELTTTAPARVWWARDGAVTEHVLDPAADLGWERASKDDLRGGDPAHNGQITREVLGGAPGAIRHAVLLNAAAALVAEGSRSGDGDLVDQMRRSVAIAEDTLDSGAAAALLDEWIELSAHYRAL